MPNAVQDYATLPLPLTPVEKEQLVDYETTIERGLTTFYEVGNAFVAIKQRKLYRAEYRTFEEYCREKWKISQQHAHRMIDAAAVVDNLKSSPIGELLPENENQARALTGLEPDQQRQVWAKAVDTAPNGKVTAQHIKDVRQQEIPMPEPEPSPVAAPVKQVSVFVPQEQPRPKYGPCAKCGKQLTGPGTFWYDNRHQEQAICDACWGDERLADDERLPDCPLCDPPVALKYKTYGKHGIFCPTCHREWPSVEVMKKLWETPEQDDSDDPAEREPEAARHLCATCDTVIVPEFEKEVEGKFYHPNCTPEKPEPAEREPEVEDSRCSIEREYCDFCDQLIPDHALFHGKSANYTICGECAESAARSLDHHIFQFMHQDRARMCAAGLVVCRVDLYKRIIFSYDPQKGGTWKPRLKCKNDGELEEAIMRVSEETNTIFENRI